MTAIWKICMFFLFIACTTVFCDEQTENYNEAAFPEGIFLFDKDADVDADEKILHGKIANETGKYPFIVSLQLKRVFSAAKYCGGSILNPRLIISAAHCFVAFLSTPKAPLYINAGTPYCFQYGPPSQFVKITAVALHPKYHEQGYHENDISLVVLATPLQFNQYVQPITIAPVNYTPPFQSEGKILGWGTINHHENETSTVLREADIPVSNLTECQRHVDGLLTENQICLGLESDTNACAGDSGGPFIQNVNGQPVLVGLTSYGKMGCYENRPIIFTRIGAYKEFIDTVIENHTPEYKDNNIYAD